MPDAGDFDEPALVIDGVEDSIRSQEKLPDIRTADSGNDVSNQWLLLKHCDM
jgi:hypothetical protein